MLMVWIVSLRNKYSISDTQRILLLSMVRIVLLRNKYSIINTQRILLWSGPSPGSWRPWAKKNLEALFTPMKLDIDHKHILIHSPRGVGGGK